MCCRHRHRSRLELEEMRAGIGPYYCLPLCVVITHIGIYSKSYVQARRMYRGRNCCLKWPQHCGYTMVYVERKENIGLLEYRRHHLNEEYPAQMKT
jgi:hypothetical protein